MRLPRFFVSPEVLTTDVVTLNGKVAHQIRQVLRLRAGESVMLLDNAGNEHTVELATVAREQVTGRIIARHTAAAEPHVSLTLYPALLKADKLEWVLQKGTEIGVAAFQPVVAERCVTNDVSDAKLARWREIVREAAEQAGRGVLPPLNAPIRFAAALPSAMSDAVSVIPHEPETHTSLHQYVRQYLGARTARLFIGPEGGFTESEITLARERFVTPVTLGKRILRAETASLVATTIILHEWEELG
jgi:16S rRNA (uracil1498-N3)-methyltransferase